MIYGELLMNKKNVNLNDYIKNYKKVCIYGAGDYAKYTYYKIREYNVKIEAFIVTSESEQEELFSIPVINYQKWKDLDYSRNIIVGVSSAYHREIKEQLEKEKISNVYFVSQEDFVDKCISVLDTSISDDNHGNEIIMEAVNSVINEVFSHCFITKLPFIDELSDYGKNLLKRSEIVILGGTNSLNSHMQTEPSFGVNYRNADIYENKIVLAGVGWYSYQDEPDEYTKNLLLKVLSKKYYHSVRDEYTANKLRLIGINNVITTGCLTTWNFNKCHINHFSSKKGEDAVVMLTPFDRKRDEQIMGFVKRNYNKIYYWSQGPMDSVYIKSLCSDAINIGTSLKQLDDFLDVHENVDYFGTRLHGGIRCIQHNRRAYIFAIDNRAEEMGKDLNLPIVHLNELKEMDAMIDGDYRFEVRIPDKKIEQWKKQFSLQL